MPIRGSKPIWPPKPSKPTGIFSSRGTQKNDGTSQFSHHDTLNYAHGSSTRSKPKSSNSSRSLTKNGGVGQHVPVAK